MNRPQEQFSRQSIRYGKGHILEDVSDIEEALALLSLPCSSACALSLVARRV